MTVICCILYCNGVKYRMFMFMCAVHCHFNSIQNEMKKFYRSLSLTFLSVFFFLLKAPVLLILDSIEYLCKFDHCICILVFSYLHLFFARCTSPPIYGIHSIFFVI
uniref:Uncharacterized protein n=1 Tax=Arundo donax TaxID=35708 RepID=A0A0A9FTZ2_ARUDO